MSVDQRVGRCLWEIASHHRVHQNRNTSFRTCLVYITLKVGIKSAAWIVLPVGVYPLPTEVEQYGTGSVEAANELDDGTYYEKTVLQFSTAEEIDNRTPMAFVVMDAQEKYFLIGAKEAPYPIVEITKGLSPDANVNDIKVTFSRKKSLIPCSI